MFLVCESWVETRTDCYIDPSSSRDHSSTSFSSWLRCSTVGHWGPKALCLPLALTSAFCLHLTLTALSTWLYYCPPASAVLPIIYTGASLNWRLGQGSIYKQGSCHKFLIEEFSGSSKILFFNFFSFIFTYLMVSSSSIPQYLYVSFTPSVLIITLSGSSTPSVMCRLLLFMSSIAHFQCKIPFLCRDSIFSLFVLGFPNLFLFGKQFNVINLHQVVDVFLRFIEYVSSCEFLKDVVE